MLEAAFEEHADEAQATVELWRGVDDPTIDRGLRTRMAKGFDARVGVRGHAGSRAGLDHRQGDRERGN